MSAVDMVDAEAVAAALAERGHWTHSPLPDAELLRVEIRRACRLRGIRVRTGIGSHDYLYACTPDGLPAEEPWRGAAIHAHASGVMDDLVLQALNRTFYGQGSAAGSEGDA